jgi:hypothetical protein
MNKNILGNYTKSSTKWEHTIIGTKGVFWSSAGKIEYIMTSAGLSLEENETSEKLTRQLYPVREILEFDKMDFDQLLQRDLDDHRVATQLIPYLLENSHKGLSFFPPIVAALLPFRKTTPKQSFDAEVRTEIEEEDGLSWLGVESEKAYKYQDLVTPDGEKAPFPVSKLSWNEGGARLVVLDGQHRAMAMLAIARTITGTWQDSGEKYKYFYEKKINDIIEKLGGKEWLETNISKIEFPVCVIKFDDESKMIDQHDSARKLFVDVNQTARRPSESRIILLSDNDLLNIFTRKTLNDIRSPNSKFPISAVEYDYPGSSSGKTQSSKPIKWSSIINIEMLRAAVLRTVFGPSKFIDTLSSRISGKPNWTDKNKYMRETLQLSEWFPREVEFEGKVFERNKVKKDYFPKNKLDEFVSFYEKSWGKSILHVLEQFYPFQAHSRALDKLLNDWSTIEVHASLAKEAISQGQGMFWTLKDSYEHWKENGQKGVDDTSRAWEAINFKKKDFDRLLSEMYLGRIDEDSIQSCKAFFDIFNTYASFVGLFLTLSTLARKHDSNGSDIPNLVASIIEVLNRTLLDKKGKLLLFLNRNIDEPLNRIKGMDTPDSIYFRYFWLEVLYKGLKESNGIDLIDTHIVADATYDARQTYLEYLKSQQISLIKSELSSKEWSENKDKLTLKAEEKALDKLSKALKKWFQMNKSEFQEWVSSSKVFQQDDQQDDT